MENPAAIESCRAYFDELWRLGASDLQSHQIDDWDRKLNRHLSTGGRPSGSTDLKDFGVDAGIPTIPDVDASPIYTDPPQAFVKFLGEGSNRVSLSVGTIEEIEETGCHWAVAYPAAAGRRPTGVEDGALIFSSRLVKGPDIRVFGRAIGMKHKEGRDDATQTDIEQRPWKSKWPRYIRVHHAEFVAGTLQNGVSLGKLMDTLGTNSFSSTQRNAISGHGNTDPRRAFMQQPAVKLSKEGFRWLNKELQKAFDLHGRVPQHDLNELDWPELPRCSG